MIIRVRTQLGTWRIEVSPTDTFGVLRDKVELQYKTDLEGRAFCGDIAGKRLFSDDVTLREAGLENGSMLYVTVNAEKTVFRIGSNDNNNSTGLGSGPKKTTVSRQITRDGTLVTSENQSDPDGFRPGMMSLRSMKKHWTLTEFVELDNKFVHKLKQQEEAICKGVSLDTRTIAEFQSFMRTLDYRRIRIAYLYGTFKPNNTVVVDALYEPPQNCTDIHFAFPDNEQGQQQQARVDKVAEFLGMKRVGVLICHPPREEGFFFSGSEVCFCAEQQLEAAQGVEDTPFVTVKMTLDMKDNSAVVVEGYQMSKQCMELVAEGVIAPSNNLGRCLVQPTFTVIQEGKPCTEVENSFFLNNVPITQHDNALLCSTFPRANRDDGSGGALLSQIPSKEALKTQILAAGKGGWTLLDKLADFQLLLFLSQYLDIDTDVRNICLSVVHRDIPLDEGYQLIVRSIAGIEM